MGALGYCRTRMERQDRRNGFCSCHIGRVGFQELIGLDDVRNGCLKDLREFHIIIINTHSTDYWAHQIMVSLSGPNNNGCFARSTREISMYKQHWSTTQPVQSYHLITHYWHLNFTTDFFELLLNLQNLSCVLLWGLEYVSWGVATHIPRFFFPVECLISEFWCNFYMSILNNLHDCQCFIIKCTVAQNVLIFLVWFWYWKNYAQMFNFVIGNMWDRRPLEQKALIFMLGNVMIWSIASS